MIILYTRVLPGVPYNEDGFIEITKGNLRKRVNKLMEDNLQIVSKDKLRNIIVKFISDTKHLKLFDSTEPLTADDNRLYTRILPYSELEEMFRIEAEYWVIRRKLIVTCTSADDKTIKVHLDKNQMSESSHTFREVEAFLRDTFNNIERISIFDSEYTNEDNLVALFKIM